MGLVIRIAINMLAVWLAVGIVTGLQFEGEWTALLVIALVLALVNAVVKPILKFVSFPLVILTLGVFLLIVNAISLAIVIWIAGALDIEFTSTGFGATFLGALVISIVTWAGEAITNRD